MALAIGSIYKIELAVSLHALRVDEINEQCRGMWMGGGEVTWTLELLFHQFTCPHRSIGCHSRS